MNGTRLLFAFGAAMCGSPCRAAARDGYLSSGSENFASCLPGAGPACPRGAGHLPGYLRSEPFACVYTRERKMLQQNGKFF